MLNKPASWRNFFLFALWGASSAGYVVYTCLTFDFVAPDFAVFYHLGDLVAGVHSEVEKVRISYQTHYSVVQGIDIYLPFVYAAALNQLYRLTFDRNMALFALPFVAALVDYGENYVMGQFVLKGDGLLDGAFISFLALDLLKWGLLLPCFSIGFYALYLQAKSMLARAG